MHSSILIASLNFGYQLMYLSFTLYGKQQNIQQAQNFAARIIIRSCKFDHITPVLGELKWLPVASMLVYRDGILAISLKQQLYGPVNFRNFRETGPKSEIFNRDTCNKNND